MLLFTKNVFASSEAFQGTDFNKSDLTGSSMQGIHEELGL
jgi:hypothetical protein